MPLRISMDWLRDYIELPEPAEDLADRLTLSGTEVEQVINLGAGWDGVLVVRVEEVTAIPGADRVRRALIDAGGRQFEVVSAAPNLRAGDLLPWAPPGTLLPNGVTIGERKFRKVTSHGMLLSPVELGVSSEADGLMVLGTEGETGIPLAQLIPPDQVMVIEVTTNRPDLLCHLGIARELSALLGRPLKLPPFRVAESEVPSPLGVSIEATDLCARYQARWVGEVTVGPSPAWLQRRLRAVGQKPISNVVDAGNYVMFESGQPLHAFDADRLHDGIVVRRAATGEQIACLDGVTRGLAGNDLVIADGRGPVAIAGIIGGAASAVTTATRNVLVEAASFTGTSVRNTSRRMGLRTEASTRFEKQLSPDLPPEAAVRMTSLLQELAGGGRASLVEDVYPAPAEQPVIRVRAGFVGTLLGMPLPDAEVAQSLRSLHFGVDEGDDGLTVRSPGFRADVHGDIDIAEEVGRLRGYNSLPSTLPGRRLPVAAILPPPDPEWAARDVAMGAGFDEAVTPSFSAPDEARIGSYPPGRVRLLNPMSREQSEMRASLAFGLARALVRNVAWGTPGARLFEVGRVFWPRPGMELPVEARIFGAAAHLPAGRPSSPAAVREGLLGLRGLLELVAAEVSGVPLAFAQDAVEGLHPGRGATISHGGQPVGHLGQLHPAVVTQLDAPGVLLVAEVNFDALVAQPRALRYRPPSRFPAVPRDLAISVPDLAPARDVLEAISSSGEVILRTVELFDEYHGPQVAAGHKGLALRLSFQAGDRTLTGEEVAAAERRIMAVLADRVGAVLRT
ncbi:MAG: phenylalanine--tRNA ligase subunit beta [Candidatus Dormibacteria bacterium]